MVLGCSLLRGDEAGRGDGCTIGTTTRSPVTPLQGSALPHVCPTAGSDTVPGPVPAGTPRAAVARGSARPSPARLCLLRLGGCGGGDVTQESHPLGDPVREDNAGPCEVNGRGASGAELSACGAWVAARVTCSHGRCRARGCREVLPGRRCESAVFRTRRPAAASSPSPGAADRAAPRALAPPSPLQTPRGDGHRGPDATRADREPRRRGRRPPFTGQSKRFMSRAARAACPVAPFRVRSLGGLPSVTRLASHRVGTKSRRPRTDAHQRTNGREAV